MVPILLRHIEELIGYVLVTLWRLFTLILVLDRLEALLVAQYYLGGDLRTAAHRVALSVDLSLLTIELLRDNLPFLTPVRVDGGVAIGAKFYALSLRFYRILLLLVRIKILLRFSELCEICALGIQVSSIIKVAVMVPILEGDRTLSLGVLALCLFWLRLQRFTIAEPYKNIALLAFLKTVLGRAV
jgi:hypothetical protein